MKVLVFGKTGQVATELQRLADVTALGRDTADLADPLHCASVVASCDADVIINAAAYTAVDRAETEEALATVINGETPAAMARAAAKRGLPFLHISTDYVFDGSGTAPMSPADTPAPLGAYGRSKLAGEQGVVAAGGPHGILRTSWIFSAHGGNFVKTMIRLGRTRDALNVVADQVGGPTAAADIAAALLAMARQFNAGRGKSGIYHFAGAPDVSWHGFATEIFNLTQITVDLAPIPTSDYPTPAARPLNSRLDCSALLADFGIDRPDWRQGLHRVLKELGEV